MISLIYVSDQKFVGFQIKNSVNLDFAHTTDDAIRKRIQNAHRAIYNAYRPVINSRMRGTFEIVKSYIGIIIKENPNRKIVSKALGPNYSILWVEID